MLEFMTKFMAMLVTITFISESPLKHSSLEDGHYAGVLVVVTGDDGVAYKCTFTVVSAEVSEFEAKDATDTFGITRNKDTWNTQVSSSRQLTLDSGAAGATVNGFEWKGHLPTGRTSKRDIYKKDVNGNEQHNEAGTITIGQNYLILHPTDKTKTVTLTYWRLSSSQQPAPAPRSGSVTQPAEGTNP